MPYVNVHALQIIYWLLKRAIFTLDPITPIGFVDCVQNAWSANWRLLLLHFDLQLFFSSQAAFEEALQSQLLRIVYGCEQLEGQGQVELIILDVVRKLGHIVLEETHFEVVEAVEDVLLLHVKEANASDFV